MFTGIIESMGTVAGVELLDQAARLTIDGGALVRECKVGDSIAVNGVCLTATEIDNARFVVTAVEETRRRTTLGDLRPGSRVNLELPLRPTDRLGGHFVQGHVDGKATVTELREEAQSVVAAFHVPRELAGYLAEKGSVAVDGVSLTIVAARDDTFSVALIPHTLKVTTLGELRVGAEVNLEVDMLAKYVARLLQRRDDASSPLTEERLRELGY